MFSFFSTEQIMMANKILIGSLVLYIITIFFSLFQLPGTLEMAIFSIPTVALLHFRYLRINLLRERNMFIKVFALIMGLLISISMLIPVITIKNNSLSNIGQFLVMSWVMLILLNIIYYSYYLVRSRERYSRMGYFIIILSGFVFLIGTGISHYIADDFMELKYITSFSLAFLSFYLYYQFILRKAMPNREIGGSLLLGAVFIYAVEILLLTFG